MTINWQSIETAPACNPDRLDHPYGPLIRLKAGQKVAIGQWQSADYIRDSETGEEQEWLACWVDEYGCRIDFEPTHWAPLDDAEKRDPNLAATTR
jgi:hypothetical protein